MDIKVRMIKRIFLAFGLITLAFLLASCKSSTSNQGGDSLQLSVASITREVSENSPITIVLEMRNKGKYPISDGVLSISGFDSDLIQGFNGNSGTGFSNNKGHFEIEGRNSFNPEGGYRMITLTANTATLPTDMPYSPTLVITACYTYETAAVGSICIDTDPYSGKVKTKSCTPGTVEIKNDQGGPVKVSSVEIEPNNGFAYIRFHLSTTGEVYDAKDVASCEEGIKREDFGMVELKSVYIGSTQLTDCMNVVNGKVRLVNGEGTFICKYNYPNTKGVLPEPFSVTLRYGVRTSLSETITIKKALI